eukprot:7710140-Lingulodinium_polyedra.AAC.1
MPLTSGSPDEDMEPDAVDADAVDANCGVGNVGVGVGGVGHVIGGVGPSCSTSISTTAASLARGVGEASSDGLAGGLTTGNGSGAAGAGDACEACEAAATSTGRGAMVATVLFRSTVTQIFEEPEPVAGSKSMGFTSATSLKCQT